MTPLRLRILHALRLQPMTCAFLARCLGYATRPEQRIVWASLERLGMSGEVRREGRVYALRGLARMRLVGDNRHACQP